MNERYLQWLEQGWTLVAANQRLVRRLQYDYACRQLQAGQRAWATPAILSWQAWLQSLWHVWNFRHPDTLLLNPHQEQALWQRIVAGSDYAGQLLHAANVARPVMDAWRILHQYQLPDPGGAYLNEDGRAFVAWARAFRRQCEEHHWCSSDNLIDRLAGEPPDPARSRTNAVVLVGFDRTTPQQHGLFDALRKSGYRIHEDTDPPPSDNRHCRVDGFADSNAEMTAAAAWARQVLNDDPAASIGIVVPDLHRQRQAVLQRFSDRLQPDRLQHCRADSGAPFSLSLGRALGGYALIDAALILLRLARYSMPLAEVGGLLRSPFLAGAEVEAASRAGLDARLRRHGEDQVNLRRLLRLGTVLVAEDRRPAGLLQGLDSVLRYLPELPEQATPDVWARHFSRLLTLFGWPGDRALNSEEQQQLQAWHDLLGRFVSLQLIDDRMTYGTALNQVSRLAAGFRFQPETEETPIQILGPSGAAAMGFDHLWVMGMHEDAWPPAVQPNPFLPISLQRQHGVPEAGAGLMLGQARADLERMIAAVPDVVISYPETDRERPLRPSPLLGKVAGEDQPGAMPDGPADYLETVRDSGALERIRDVHAPALAHEESVAGGSGLFRDQSACPFRAFARYRLFASALEQVDIGLDARQRGLLLHRVLQVFWNRVGSHEGLAQMPPAQCRSLIQEVVSAVLAEERRRQPRTYTGRFSAIEQQRLESVLRDWLEQEKARLPFRVVACEETQEFGFDGIRIQARIDRVDQLADGREVIIDYKTGKCGVNDWLGERPADPQLPLYALMRPGPVAALAYACLRRGSNFGYRGLAEEDDLLPDSRAFSSTPLARKLVPIERAPLEWPELLTGWQQTLERLATGFRDGDARVDPKDGNACRYCDQHVLCRIYEVEGFGAGLREDEEYE